MLLAVVLGGVVSPAASIIIPGIDSVANAATCGYSYDESTKTLTITSGDLPENFRYDFTGAQYAETIVLISDATSAEKVVAPANSSNLFFNLVNLKQIKGSQNLDVSHVTNMTTMFYSCRNLESIDVSNWDMSTVKQMDHTFGYCTSLTTLDVRDWDMRNVENMRGLFAYSENIENLDVSQWETDSVIDTSIMFNRLEKLTNLNVSNFNTSNVTTMRYMFGGTSGLKQLDVSHLNTTNVKNMEGMFYGTGLTTLDLSDFDTRGVTNMNNMLANTSAMWKITLGPKCTLLAENGLPDPVVGTDFHGEKVGSDKWMNKTGGTDYFPTGTEYSAAQIATSHVLGNTDIYVWQGGMLGDSTVEYAVEPSYIVTIPTGITIDPTTKLGSGSVVLGANPKLPYDERIITVRVNSTNSWKLKIPNEQTDVAYNFGTSTTGSELKAGGKITFTADGENNEAISTPVYASLPSGSDFKYAEKYSDTVNYTISTGVPTPVPAPGTQIMLGGEAFNFIKEENGKYLVIQDANVATGPYYGSNANVSYNDSLLKGQVDTWFNNKFTGHTNDGNADTITVDGYKIYKTTLNGATSNAEGTPDNFKDPTFQNGYLSTPNGGTGTNAISAYAFVLSKADLNAQTADMGEETPETLLASNGENTWNRSPAMGPLISLNLVAGLEGYGAVAIYRVTTSQQIRAAFWISVD